jgi:hypothetical protein
MSSAQQNYNNVGQAINGVNRVTNDGPMVKPTMVNPSMSGGRRSIKSMCNKLKSMRMRKRCMKGKGKSMKGKGKKSMKKGKSMKGKGKKSMKKGKSRKNKSRRH